MARTGCRPHPVDDTTAERTAGSWSEQKLRASASGNRGAPGMEWTRERLTKSATSGLLSAASAPYATSTSTRDSAAGDPPARSHRWHGASGFLGGNLEANGAEQPVRRRESGTCGRSSPMTEAPYAASTLLHDRAGQTRVDQGGQELPSVGARIQACGSRSGRQSSSGDGSWSGQQSSSGEVRMYGATGATSATGATTRDEQGRRKPFVRRAHRGTNEAGESPLFDSCNQSCGSRSGRESASVDARNQSCDATCATSGLPTVSAPSTFVESRRKSRGVGSERRRESSGVSADDARSQEASVRSLAEESVCLRRQLEVLDAVKSEEHSKVLAGIFRYHLGSHIDCDGVDARDVDEILQLVGLTRIRVTCDMSICELTLGWAHQACPCELKEADRRKARLPSSLRDLAELVATLRERLRDAWVCDDKEGGLARECVRVLAAQQDDIRSSEQRARAAEQRERKALAPGRDAAHLRVDDQKRNLADARMFC